MEDFKRFWSTYGGAIIGIIVAILLLCTHVYEVIIWIIFIALGIWLGNYIQHNKDLVKNKIKDFIDKL